MDAILNTYKERLINISSRNRSLVTRKLYKKRALDLYTLKKFNEGIDEDIIDLIINRKGSSIEILEDHVKYLQHNLTLIEKEIRLEEKSQISKIENNKIIKE